MRNLCLILILVNLGFAAWQSWFVLPSSPERARANAAPTIHLVGESNPPGEPISAGIDTADLLIGDLGIAYTCLSMGPLPDRVVVEQAESSLSNAGFSTRRRTALGEVFVGYWVYIDAIKDQAEANNIVSLLKDSGIQEAYVIADGNNGNLISLGVFSVQSRAELRLTQARELGYSPVAADRSQPGEVFWLDITADSGTKFLPTAVPLPSGETAPSLVACDESE